MKINLEGADGFMACLWHVPWLHQILGAIAVASLMTPVTSEVNRTTHASDKGFRSARINKCAVAWKACGNNGHVWLNNLPNNNVGLEVCVDACS